MSSIERTINKKLIQSKQNNDLFLIDKLISQISSVHFGIILLILILIVCMIGMLIIQQNSLGFEKYASELNPIQRTLYDLLGFFDIYHTWYFNGLLGLLSINIILASIERFPKTWKFVRRPKIYTSENWLKKQTPYFCFNLSNSKEEIIAKISNLLNANGWRKLLVSEKDEKTFIFAEKNAWNRLGAYPVHIALLIIIFGGFYSSQFSFSGEIPITVGQKSNHLNGNLSIENAQLPFKLSCLDLEQKLINPQGSIETNNTLDWLTYLQIEDESGTQKGIVQLNKPFSYQNYRIFHSSNLLIGKAREIIVQITDNQGKTQNVKINRDSSIALDDKTQVKFVEFESNFSLEKENYDKNSAKYQNPTAILEVISPENAKQTVYALSDGISENKDFLQKTKDYSFKLVDFERVSEQHTLFIRYDPGIKIVYFGFGLLILTLSAVFFFSHQRIWSVIEEISEETFRIIIGGNTNRNQIAFEEKFESFFVNIKRQNQQ